jgi:hypothetical protein
MINGHCECGRIRYEVQCRRLHGAAYATFAAVPRDKFRYITGENEIKVYASSASNDRLFCGECGSNILAAAKEEPETLYLSMSSVEGNPPLPGGYHAYVGSKAPWHEITDDLPQYEEWAPE